MQMLPSLAMFGAGWGAGEIGLIFVVVLVLFGPKRLPEIARMLGRTMEQLRRASQEFKDQVMNLDDPLRPEASHETKPVAPDALKRASADKAAGRPWADAAPDGGEGITPPPEEVAEPPDEPRES